MNRKKNAFSQCIWFLYTVAAAVILFFTARYIGQEMGVRAEVYAPVGVGAAILCFGLVSLVKVLRRPESDRIGVVILLGALEGILVASLIVGGVYLRVMNIPEQIAGSYYFDFAKVTAGGKIPVMVHGAVYFYLYFLHAVCIFLGNNILACVYAQIAVNALTGLILYGAVRRLSGAFPGLTVLALVACSPYMIGESLKLQPVNLYLLLFAIALFLAAHYLKSIRENLVGIFLTGALIALVTYIDITGVILVVFLFGIFGMRRDYLHSIELEERDPHPRAVVFVTAMVGFIGVFAGLIAADAWISGNSQLDVLNAWSQLFLPGRARIPVDVFAQYGSVVLVILTLLYVIGVFSYRLKNRIDNLSLWFIATVGLFLMEAFCIPTDELTGAVPLFVFASVLGGVALGNLFTPLEEIDPFVDDLELEEEDRYTPKRVYEDEPAVEEKPALRERREPAPIEIYEDPDKTEEPVVPVRRKSTRAGRPIENLDELLPVIEREKPVSIEKDPEIKFLDNPLPVPVKRHKKAADFDIAGSERDDYDIFVADDDDFDI